MKIVRIRAKKGLEYVKDLIRDSGFTSKEMILKTLEEHIGYDGLYLVAGFEDTEVKGFAMANCSPRGVSLLQLQGEKELKKRLLLKVLLWAQGHEVSKVSIVSEDEEEMNDLGFRTEQYIMTLDLAEDFEEELVKVFSKGDK